jgi:heterodisulfide reductase subunit B1
MNIEGKKKIWQDYQKEIADDDFFYARSCVRQSFFSRIRNNIFKDIEG